MSYTESQQLNVQFIKADLFADFIGHGSLQWHVIDILQPVSLFTIMFSSVKNVLLSRQ